MTKCKECVYCKQTGRTKSEYSSNRKSRSTYYCKHEKVHEMKDKHGLPLNNFIGFGKAKHEWEDSQLVLKTSKSWCPLKEGSVNNG